MDEKELDKMVDHLYDNEIICSDSTMIDFMLAAARCCEGLPVDPPFTDDDVFEASSPICPHCGEQDVVSGDYRNYHCNSCEEEFDEPKMPEVLEWWRVAGFLADDLQRHNEVVIRTGSANYWGRCISGQSVKSDYVIREIAEELYKKNHKTEA